MAQRYCTVIGPAVPFRRDNLGTATALVTTAPVSIVWATGGTDTIAQGTVPTIQGTGASSYDHTAGDWLICTALGSGTLTLVPYSSVATVFSLFGADSAVLWWSTWACLRIWQQ